MIEIRYATLDDLPRVIQIQERAHDVLIHKAWLVYVDPSELKRAILNQHMAVALIEGEIASFRTLEKSDDDYLGHYNGLSHHPDIIYSDLSIVDPEYRGMGLQKKMGEWLFNNVRERYIYATVHPDNIASMKDKFFLGMHIIAYDEVYPNKNRFVFFKDSNKSFKPMKATCVKVPLTFEETFKPLFHDGYVGTALDEDVLIFCK